MYAVPLSDITEEAEVKTVRRFENALRVPATTPRKTCPLCGAPLGRSNTDKICRAFHTPEQKRRALWKQSGGDKNLPPSVLPESGEELLAIMCRVLPITREEFDKPHRGTNDIAIMVSVGIYLLRVDLQMKYFEIDELLDNKGISSLQAMVARMKARLVDNPTCIEYVVRVREAYPKRHK